MEHTFITPLYIDLPRKTKKDKRVYINLNTYRNLHHRVNNDVKKQYQEAMSPQLWGKTINTPVEITYKVFKASKRRLDKMNVVAVTSKYFLDAVTYFKCWEDDSDDYVKKETILPTELDRENPRVEITIKEI